MRKVAEHLDLFIQDKHEQNIKSNTLEKYNKILLPFLKFIEKEKIHSLSNLSKSSFIDYFEKSTAYTNSLYTKKMHLNTLKMFIKYSLEKEGLIFFFKEFDSIKITTPEILPTFYSDETINTLLEYINGNITVDRRTNDLKNIEEKSRFFDLRAKIILFLLIKTGVKQEELAELRLCNFNISEGGRSFHISVSRTKRGERVIPLKRGLIIEKLLANYKELMNCDYICSSYSGNKLIRVAIVEVLQHVFEKLNLEYLGIQAFRHTYALNLAKDGFSKERMRILLGYRNTKPVLRYFDYAKNKS